MKKRLTIEQMHELAAKKGGRCLSTTYVNNKTHLTWQCANGHTWLATPSNIQLVSWCPTCARDQRMYTLEEMQQIAAKHGGKCLSARYVNTRTKLFWQCAKGHTWKAEPHSIQRGGWCPVCAGKQKLTLTIMQREAHKHGGTCLSTTYVNNHTKLLWQCVKGHTWLAQPRNIQQGNWCPSCWRERNRKNRV